MKARRRFGQHFLTDESVIDRIVASIAVKNDQRVVEIGPGRGVLTGALMAAADFRAVEIDRDLVVALRARFPDIDLVQGDILKVDMGEILPPGGTRIVGNLPYNITSPLLGRLLAEHARIDDMHFMLQREVVQRLAASPATSDWGRLAVFAQYLCTVTPLFDVPPTCFQPRPKVFSAFVKLVPRSGPWPVEVAELQQVVRVAFGQRRKRLSNALKSFDLNWTSLAVDPNLRPQDLDLDGYVAITQQVVRRTGDAS